MKPDWFLAVAKKTQQLIGTAYVNKHVTKMFEESASIEHELAPFYIGWFVAYGLFKARSREEELAVAPRVAQGLKMIAIGTKYPLAEANGSVLALANLEAAWDDGRSLLNDLRLKCNDLRFAKQRSMISRDLQH